MAERLILVKIPGPEKATQVTRVLTQIPNLTSGVIQNQLKILPFLLPPLEDYNLQKNIKERLEKLGCHVVVKYIEDKKENPGSDKKEDPATKPKLAKTKPVEIVRRKYTPPSDKTDPIPTFSKELKKNNIKEWSVFTGLLVLVGILYWISTLSSKPSRSPQNSKYTERPLTESHSRNTESEEEEKRPSFRHPYAQNLELELEQNPFNSQAWKKLIRYHREQGNHGEARRLTRESWEKNEKVRAALKSIALKFGTPAMPMELNKEKFRMDLHVTERLDPYEKGYGIYNELEPEFGEKHLQVFFRHKDGDVYELDVPPGKGQMDEHRIQRFVHKREN